MGSNPTASATKSNPAKPVGLLFLLSATVLARVCEHKKCRNAKHCRIVCRGKNHPQGGWDVLCVTKTYATACGCIVRMRWDSRHLQCQMPRRALRAEPTFVADASLCEYTHSLAITLDSLATNPKSQGGWDLRCGRLKKVFVAYNAIVGYN